MNLIDFLRPAQTAQEELLKIGANSIIKSFAQDVMDNKKHPPVVVVDYKKRLQQFDKSWKKDVPKNILYGRRCQHIILQHVANY